MKIKYEGPLDEITVRHKDFEKGKAVELDPDEPKDASLIAKLIKRPDFSEVKRGRKPKNDQDGA